MAKIIEVIYTTIIRGDGKLESSPVREIEQWFSKEGELLLEKDPFRDSTKRKEKGDK